MAILRNSDIKKMNSDEITEKIKDLKMELIKNKVASAKGGKIKIKEIKRTIAKLLTFNRLNLGKEAVKKTVNFQESSKKDSKKSVKK